MKGYQVKKERGPSLFLVGSFIALTIITLLMFFLLSRYISGESNTALARSIWRAFLTRFPSTFRPLLICG